MTASPLQLFGRFFDPYYWQTAVLLAKNGLARQYRNSFLGLLWTLLQPLTMVIVYIIVMPTISKFPTPNYPLYIIVSLPTWTFFSSTFIYASYSLLNNGETLKRCMISSTVFPIADVLRHTYIYLVSFLVMYTVGMLFFHGYSPTIFLLPLYFLPVVMIMGAIAIGIAFLAPYLRDIGELIMLSMNMLFWLTPVIYPYDILPPWAQHAMKFNPFFIMLHPLQMLGYSHVVPGIGETIRLLVLAVVAILVGFGIFRLCRRNYVYYL